MKNTTIATIGTLKEKCEALGYEFSCDAIAPYCSIKIKNHSKGIVVLLSARDDEYFAGAALPLAQLPKVLEDWKAYKEKGREETIGWYAYNNTNFPKNHDLSVWEVMQFLDGCCISAIAI